MKRILTLLLSVAILLSFTACSTKKEEKDDTEKKSVKVKQIAKSNYYVYNGYAVECIEPVNEKNLNQNVDIIKQICEEYPIGTKVYTAVIPDKGYFLAGKDGFPDVDYEKIFQLVKEGVPDASYIDLTKELQLEDYYYSGTQWSQDRIVPVAQKLGEAMGVTVDELSDYTIEKVEQPYYGVYYDLFPAIESDTMYLMHSEVLDGCTVRVFSEIGQTPAQHKWEEGAFYDMSKTELNDSNISMDNIFFSGIQTMIRIINPNGPKGRELVVFGDSYARNLVPLLVSGYSKVTLIDLRMKPIYDRLNEYLYVNPRQDVLFLYSTFSLNTIIAL